MHTRRIKQYIAHEFMIRWIKHGGLGNLAAQAKRIEIHPYCLLGITTLDRQDRHITG